MELTEAAMLGDGVTDADAVVETDGLAVADGVGESDSTGVPVGVGVAEGVDVTDAPGVGVTEGVTVGAGDVGGLRESGSTAGGDVDGVAEVVGDGNGDSRIASTHLKPTPLPHLATAQPWERHSLRARGRTARMQISPHTDATLAPQKCPVPPTFVLHGRTSHWLEVHPAAAVNWLL